MINNILLFLVLLIPPSLVSGPFLPDLFVSFAGLLFLYKCIKDNLWIYLSNKYFIIFIFFYFYIVSRSIFSDNILLSLESSLFYFRYIFFCYAVVYLFEKKKNFYKFFFISTSITLAVVFIDSSLQFFYGRNSLGYTIHIHDHYISGFFGDEKILGSFFTRILPIFLFFYFLFFKDKFSSNIMLIIIFFLSLFITIISGERSSILLIILFYFCLIIFLNKMILFRLSILFFIMSICTVILFLSIKVINNTNYLIVSDYDSSYKKYEKLLTRNIKETITELGLRENQYYFFSKVHQSHYDSALKMFSDNIIFGQGPKMFRMLCNQEKYHSVFGKNKFNNIVHCSTHPHNTYIQLLAETGMIGFLLPFVFFLFVIYRLIQHLYHKLFKKVIILTNPRICLMSCIFINLWPLIPTGNFFNNWLSIFYYLPIAFYLSNYLKRYSSL